MSMGQFFLSGDEPPVVPKDSATLSELLDAVRKLLVQKTDLPTSETHLQSASLQSLVEGSFDGTEMHSMDPRLQFIVAKRQTGALCEATMSSSVDEVAVLARVSDVRAWEELSEVRIGGTIGSPGGANDFIVTGRIPASRIEAVRQQPFVLSLKASQELRPFLHASTEETGARPVLLPAGHQTNGGAGVLIGIIDYGCDFAHRNFRNADGSTRLRAIWHQSGPTSATSPFGYGREYSAGDINAALNTTDPYGALGYGPTPDSQMSNPGTHGTHVMDIAAGNGRGSGISGIAPQADLIFVDVSHSDIAFSGQGVVGSSFGDSVRLLEACRYIFNKAGDEPCVINISLGTNGGPHDGSTLVELGIDSLLQQKPNRAIVIAASNSFSDGIHAAGSVPANGHVDLKWQVRANDTSQNEFELWYSGADAFDVELIAPNGTSLGRVATNATLPLGINNRVAVFIANRFNDPNNHDNMIGIFLESRFPGWNPTGTWTVRVHGASVTTNGAFHAWIERDNVTPSRFAPPHDNTHTLGSISCGRHSIVCGSYDAHKPSRPISFFSSSGPTRDGRNKPEISAPGHAVVAAHSRTSTGTIGKSGTSMASPAVTGICALVLAEANARGLDLTIEQLQTILTQSARRDPPTGTAWDARFGHGRIFASGAVQAVIDLAVSGGTSAEPDPQVPAPLVDAPTPAEPAEAATESFSLVRRKVKRNPRKKAAKKKTAQ